MKYDLKNLTLEEKINLLTGKYSKEDWILEDCNGKLPSVSVADGPHGLRDYHKPDECLSMPSAVVLANTWNTELAYLFGNTIADDYIEHDVQINLAPAINIKRTPLCGRNFEYYSEDPFLAGHIAKNYILGFQDQGIGTSLKHFCLNNNEYERNYQSSEVDERTIREIYLPAFEIALQAKPWTVMCAYNLINGIYASEHKKLMKDVLRDEFGFDGVLVSDWHAVCDRARSLKVKLDLEMPYSPTAYDEIMSAYKSGYITIEEIDESAGRMLELIEKTQCEKKVKYSKEQRLENARKIAREGIVLLKNEDNILPLKGGKIMLAGAMARYPIYSGGGSAGSFYKTSPSDRDRLFTEIQQRLSEEGTVYYGGDGAWTDNIRNYTSHSKVVYKNAYSADTVVLFVGDGMEDERENADRTKIKLHVQQEKMILETAKVNKNVVVVVNAGSAIDMSAWIDKVKGVVFMGYLGQTTKEALADILTGMESPSGKLSETFPLCLEDTPSGKNFGNGSVNRYEEGIFMGYRHYDEKELDVLYPFGHGLSYAKFEYSDLKVEKTGKTDYKVTYKIKNVSDVDAKEISQVYVRDVFSNVSRPQKELKGFNKTFIKAGEEKEIETNLNFRSFAFYSVALNKWHIENGDFEILVGASSRDIRLMEKIKIELPWEEQFSLEDGKYITI